MKSFKSSVFTVMYILIYTLTYAQSTKSLELIDKSENSPIPGVSFQYSTQSGISDNNGMINLEYKPGEKLRLRHISYGKWILKDDEVKKAFSDGKIIRERIFITLQPVSIVALHSLNGAKKIDLNYNNKLHHDAGAVLNSDISINSIKKSGSYGFDPVLRGFKYDQLNIVMNGSCSASAACPSRMDPVTSQIPLNTIDNIQILKGPYSLRFGNSFGGTINFLTSKPVFSEKLKPFGRLSNTYENNGNISRNEGLLGLRSKKFDFNIFGSWSQGDDYKDGNDKVVQSDFLRGSFGTNFTVKLAENQTFGLSVNRNLGRDTDFPALPMDLRSDDTWMLNAQHDLIFTNRSLASWKTIIYATHVDHLMDNSLKQLNPRTVNTKSPTQTLTFGGRTESCWQINNNTTFIGFDLRVENAEGSRTREMLTGVNAGKVFTDNIWQNSTISRSAIFAETNFKTNRFLYVIAGRLELNKSSAKDIAAEFTNIYKETTQSQINPGLSLGIIKNLNDKYALKLWAGRSQRSGSLTEKYINYFSVGRDAYELLGNPRIKPEINNQADLIFELKTEKTYFNVDVFASCLQNYITSVIRTDLKPRITSSPGVRQFLNTGNAFKTGFEINWKQYLIFGFQHQAGIAYTYGVNKEIEEPLPEIAPLEFRYSITGKHLNNKLNTEISLRHVLKQDRISVSFGEKETPSFTIMDASISYKLIKSINIAAGIQNIFDVAYYEHLNRPLNGSSTEFIYNRGRNYFLSLIIDIK